MRNVRQLRQRMAGENFPLELLIAFLFVWVVALGEAYWLASDWSLRDITLLAAVVAGALELGEVLWAVSAPSAARAS